ncbi:SMP-30/gluconolactonase/LRE family protein [Massilia forsythiae]|uniref:SMP-30/gluconolactonase/LRE family protein n=1 Tax=Massilia forsythiae TaxID=2728020 RepID=A0A7Z2ZUP6_9BURK|nr:SMP-30/gluconolactonase/LRE family protein [Massilia forsythiae]QJE02773.1 SMP-30/gluconolactonase/LRE family protein [Massilia forsythiae]
MNERRTAPASSRIRLAAAALVAALAVPALAQPMACSGKAPAGELRAERIAAVEPTRSEGLYEGPVWIEGALYFSDFGNGPAFPSRIRKLAADGSVRTVVEDSGSNGLAVDAGGNLVTANHKQKAVTRLALDGAAAAKGNGGGKSGDKGAVLAGRYQGQVFNSPNDIAIAAEGTLYFTDPDFQKAAAPGGQPVTGVYRVGTDGRVTLVDGSRRNPNGIALSPAGDVLYVNAGDGLLRAHPVAGGVPGAGRDIVRGLEVPDGMAVDCHGNVYVTEHTAHRVRVFSPQGKELATIRVDANVTNAAFGGADGKTLYLTGAGALWQVRLDVTGSPY